MKRIAKMPRYSLRRLGLKCCINFVYVMLNNVVICFSCNVLTIYFGNEIWIIKLLSQIAL
ncbi:hypothetical protein HanHA300_Chr16g0632951 [Helianthus annuus]|nr:hypothetical protein HanHA300_Chr17g0641691 [Helianthus annuus]KAJ0440124.1 hypothetical protein HanHA300_Chr16g0632951 [Helianthus annuus]KAJ0528695.1 hypothetical protein HanHA89_Chr10g0369261 [Helianthus annuus]KAJ0695607.1 hypothetical protein HanLR1_Chr10g0347441 [Helianthus annuus]KAJ0772620.1 hypothetical protein HanOQP8_Chr03g0089471 [Helianthus annuus]